MFKALRKNTTVETVEVCNIAHGFTGVVRISVISKIL